MPDHVLWIEGVDFGRTVEDTSDLSTRRGASLALLDAPQRLKTLLEEHAVKVKTIFIGASMGAFKLEGDGQAVNTAIAAALAALAEKNPFAHLRFVHGLAEVGAKGADHALKAAQARARFAQFRIGETGPVRPSGQGTRYCPVDRMRAADGKMWVPPEAWPKGVQPDPGIKQFNPTRLGHGDDENGTRKPEAKEILVSSAVAARRQSGRKARQEFYARLPGAAPGPFVDSLQEMVEHGDGFAKELRLSVGGKIAVFYADGNGFTKIRDAMAEKKGRIGALNKFSTELQELQKEKLLRPMLEGLVHLRDHSDSRERVAWRDERGIDRLRLETLLWGGDEVMWAVPAWLGWWLARRFLDRTRDWKIDDHPLTFSAGLLFCPVKTPIRDACKVAHDLADIAKTRAKAQDPAIGALEVEVLESIDAPLDGIAGLRRRLTGLDGESSLLTIPAAEIEALNGKLLRLKGRDGKPGLPLSQVHRILRGLERGKGLPQSGHKAAKDFTAYLERQGTECHPDLDASWLELAEATKGPEHTALNLFRIAQLWDYVGPFPGDPP